MDVPHYSAILSPCVSVITTPRPTFKGISYTV